MKDSLAKNTIMLTIGTALNNIFKFFMGPLFSRWLSVEDYGTCDLFSSYVGLLIPVITLSTQEALFRYCVDEDRVQIRKQYIASAFVIVMLNTVVVSLIVAGVNDSLVYISFLALLFSEVFSVYLKGYLRGLKKLYIYSFAAVISTIFTLFFVTYFVRITGYGVCGFMFGYAFGSLAGSIVICIWSGWFRHFSIRMAKITYMKSLIAYSYPLIANDMSWWVMNASDRQIIRIFFGAEANGIYAVSHKIPSLCSTILGVFSVSWQQEVSVRINDEGCRIYFRDVFQKILGILLPLCSLILSVNFLFFEYIFDARYRMGAVYAPILLLSAAVVPVIQYLGGIQIALKRPKENGATTITGACCNVIFHLILLHLIGLYAAAVSTLIANLVIVGIRAVKLKDIVSIRPDRRNGWEMVMLLYYFMASYYTKNDIFNYFNLGSAVILFVILNRGLVCKIIGICKVGGNKAE